MEKIKKFLKILFSKKGLTVSQIANLIRYSFFKKGEIVNYDPITLLIFVTDRCNFHCRFCPHHSKLIKEKYPFFHEESSDFTLEKFKKVLNIFSNAILVTFAGVGEPLLNKEIFDMADYATSKNIYSQLITNGILLDQEAIKRIMNNPNFYSVSISLNAITPEEYAKNFDGRKEFFDKIVSNIKKLTYQKKKNRHFLEVAISFVIHKNNFFQMKSFIEFAENLGIDRVNFYNLIDFGIEEFRQAEQLDANDLKQRYYLEEIKKFLKTKKIKVNLPILFSSKVKKRCPWFFKNISIDGDGNIGGCGRVINPSSKYGNVFQERKNVWNNPYFQNMRKIFLDPNIPLLECCQKCVENQC